MQGSPRLCEWKMNANYLRFILFSNICWSHAGDVSPTSIWERFSRHDLRRAFGPLWAVHEHLLRDKEPHLLGTNSTYSDDDVMIPLSRSSYLTVADFTEPSVYPIPICMWITSDLHVMHSGIKVRHQSFTTVGRRQCNRSPESRSQMYSTFSTGVQSQVWNLYEKLTTVRRQYQLVICATECASASEFRWEGAFAFTEFVLRSVPSRFAEL